MGETEGTVNARVVLDWMVRILIVVISVLVTAIFAHTRRQSERNHLLEIRVERLEANSVQRETIQAIRDQIASRPTRSEIQADLQEIKSMISELRQDVRANR